MRIKYLLNLILYFQIICSNNAIPWTTYPTTSDQLLIVENLQLKNEPKTKIKSRHSSHSVQITSKPIVQTKTNRDMGFISSSDQQDFKQKKPNFESPAIKAKNLWNRRRKKVLNNVETNPFEREINSLRSAENCLNRLIPELEKLDMRVRHLYKLTRRRRLLFFDTMLLKTQRFVDYLINTAHEQTDTLGQTANKLNWVLPKKTSKRKPTINRQQINNLLSNADSLKKKIVYSIEELNAALDEFVDQFGIKEERSGDLLIHSDGTYELNE